MKIFYSLDEANEALKKIPVAERARLRNQQTNIRLTDVVPGEKHTDGGEYGFYTRLQCKRTGLFLIYTTCTCDFDRCGTTGYLVVFSNCFSSPRLAWAFFLSFISIYGIISLCNNINDAVLEVASDYHEII